MPAPATAALRIAVNAFVRIEPRTVIDSDVSPEVSVHTPTPAPE